MRIAHCLIALALLAPTLARADVTGPGPFAVGATTITWTRTSSTTGQPATVASPSDTRLDDMRCVLDQILAEDDRVGSPFYLRLTPRPCGRRGHSSGGLDAPRVAASEPRARAALALAPARPDLSGGR